MALSCIISEKIVTFSFYTPTFDAPLGGYPPEYCHPVWLGKTRVVWPSDGGKSFMICLAALTQYWRVTDGQTDI